MSFFNRIKKTRIFGDFKLTWFLLTISIVFIFLRLPSLIEPSWYGDEGIYQVVGRSISNGDILYKSIWDNKPPLLYIIYAIFDGNLFFVKLASLVSGLLALISFYLLTNKLFKNPISQYTSIAVFALLFALPILEGNIANAENFMLFPIILGAYFVLRYKDSEKIFHIVLAGVLLSIAFITKIVALFDFLAFFIFLEILLWKDHGKNILKFKYLKNNIIFSFAFSSLMIIVSFYFLYNNAFNDFLSGVFSENISYVNVENSFIIPNGILILKSFLLLGILFFIFKKRKSFENSELFIYLWLAFSIYNSLFSQRPYIHYILVMLPSFSLLIGKAIESRKKFFINILILSSMILISIYHFTIYKKTFEYYVNYFDFMNGKKTVIEYEKFFDQQTPNNYEIANFINTNINKNDGVFLWSDNAQIYALSNRLPIGKYMVAYHITFYKDAVQETVNAIDLKKPKFIIQTAQAPIPPGIIVNYSLKYEILNTKIYEREF